MISSALFYSGLLLIISTCIAFVFIHFKEFKIAMGFHGDVDTEAGAKENHHRFNKTFNIMSSTTQADIVNLSQDDFRSTRIYLTSQFEIAKLNLEIYNLKYGKDGNNEKEEVFLFANPPNKNSPGFMVVEALTHDSIRRLSQRKYDLPKSTESKISFLTD